MEVLSTRDGYDRWAEIYDGEDNPLIALEEPLVARLLGDVRGRTLADIGCGTGRHSLRWAAAGARVTALDFSDVMLRRARGKPGAEHVHFLAHDLAQPLPLDSVAFDRVLCCLVVDHIPDLAGFFREMKRICRPDGFLIVSVMHPAMMLRGIQARFHDPVTGREVRPRSCPHEIADYVMAAARAGWYFDHMSEYKVDEVLATGSPRAVKYLGWPLLLLLRLRPTEQAATPGS
jgi:malonyl-CoA O-methyltransferase